MTTSASSTGFDVTPLSSARVDALAAGLTPDERRVILDHGTERPFCGLLLDNKQPGTYVCRLCGLPLFDSDAKFQSGTGWPSFWKTFDAAHVREIRDVSLGMVRVEIRCTLLPILTSATCSTMARRRPTCATASIPLRCSS